MEVVPVLSKRSIRVKLRIGVGLLALSTIALFSAAMYGLYAYRGLVRSLSARSAELPLAQELSKHMSDTHAVLAQARERAIRIGRYGETYSGFSLPNESESERRVAALDLSLLRADYRAKFESFKTTLAKYRERLDANQDSDRLHIGDDVRERQTLAGIDRVLSRIEEERLDDSLFMETAAGDSDKLEAEVAMLRELTAELPRHLYDRLHDLSGEVRSQYHIAFTLAWATFLSALGLLALAVQVFRTTIARPLRVLAQGARKVADDDFAHRIRLDSKDEIGEVADAMNAMMSHFQQTRDDLDQQVKDRTQEVVRSEQLASVGFLAAGVAHEINNPLASITLCSESLESRVAELADASSPEKAPEWEVVISYLEMIQKESFRCKQITEKLLDFSRMGDSERRAADLRELVQGVVEMVRHLGKYKRKTIDLADGPPVIVEVNAQEMKQVVLNLVTNGLDSLEEGGRVVVAIRSEGGAAKIVVSDNGCGMTDEVKRHLFEPFFTRRKGGQGTGLGLSITYRIVQEHGGQIAVDSEGPGLGSSFTVSLPVDAAGAVAA